MSLCARAHAVSKHIMRNLALYMEYMYSFNNASYTSHELPRHEKICLRGLRPGRRHKTFCTAKEANWRLEFVINEKTSTFDFVFAQ